MQAAPSGAVGAGVAAGGCGRHQPGIQPAGQHPGSGPRQRGRQLLGVPTRGLGVRQVHPGRPRVPHCAGGWLFYFIYIVHRFTKCLHPNISPVVLNAIQEFWLKRITTKITTTGCL